MSESSRSHARLVIGDPEMLGRATSYPCASPGNSRCAAPCSTSPSALGVRAAIPCPALLVELGRRAVTGDTRSVRASQSPRPSAAGAAGDLHHQALRALANRLVGYLHGCLRTRSRYDETTAWGHRDDRQELAA